MMFSDRRHKRFGLRRLLLPAMGITALHCLPATRFVPRSDSRSSDNAWLHLSIGVGCAC